MNTVLNSDNISSIILNCGDDSVEETIAKSQDAFTRSEMAKAVEKIHYSRLNQNYSSSYLLGWNEAMQAVLKVLEGKE